MGRDQDRDEDHPHAHNADAPGASGPGEPGYDGDVRVGDEGAVPDQLGDES